MSKNIVNFLRTKTLAPIVVAIFAILPLSSLAQATLPFTMTEEALNNSSIVINSDAPSVTWVSDNNGVRLGGTGDGFSYKDKYIDIAFDGIPDVLSFQVISKGAGIFPVTDADWYVLETSDNLSWPASSNAVWSKSNISYENSLSETFNVKLSSTTRYVRLCYSGNFGGSFCNINITPKEFALKVIVNDEVLREEKVRPYAPITIEQPNDECYTFLGWDKEVPEVMPFEDLILTAETRLNQYTSHFKVSNPELGVEVADFDKVFDCGTEVSVENPSQVGYTFDSWEPALPEIVSAEMEGATYTAKWTHNEYVLSLIIKEDSVIEKKLHYVTPVRLRWSKTSCRSFSRPLIMWLTPDWV